ncbi:hypothetical protein ACN38_g949, partial [Penicillium nordicum]
DRGGLDSFRTIGRLVITTSIIYPNHPCQSIIHLHNSPQSTI